ncbi:MAG: hypothetical protein PHW25_08405 [Zoogloea sp.]|uniref:hypothetical protein n=1 Tax=Zoogloea sp. TaxID=49181 RepID=UPI002626659F|nr:hypothetical protein [Zoogloea sp.]MDD3327091.1 hypothetical protein [Zoogloea sp.]
MPARHPIAGQLALQITLFAMGGGPALAEVITVGPSEPVERIADAARLARDGDTVLIKPGTYRGDVAVWLQRDLEIRGIGARPVLLADGQVAEGKGIWVFRSGRFRIRNIEFRGARAPAGNGAGIRFEHGSLDLADCVFEDNEMGILTGNVADSELRIAGSVFGHAPRGGPLLPHLLYVGQISRFVLEGSRFVQGQRGHLVKSRARVNEVRYNWLADGPGGSASYELEFPEGGDARVVGNLIAQSATTDNPAIVSYGAENGRWPVNRLQMSHNTLINDGPRPGQFVRVWFERLPADTRVTTRNNLLAGPGSFVEAMPGDHQGNTRLPAGTPLPDSGWPGPQLAPVPPAADSGLAPEAEFRFPAGTRPLAARPRWLPGAFQTAPASDAPAP